MSSQMHTQRPVQMPLGHKPRIMRDPEQGFLVVRDEMDITPEEHLAQPRTRRLKIGDLVIHHVDGLPTKAVVKDIDDEAREVILDHADGWRRRRAWSSITPLTDTLCPVVVNIVAITRDPAPRHVETPLDDGRHVQVMTCPNLGMARARIETLKKFNEAHGITADYTLQLTLLRGPIAMLR